MEQNPPRDAPEDPRTAFLRALPRKVVEIKATFGALIADPRSSRMRDELRRKLNALFTLARSYHLPALADDLRASVDILDATRAQPALARAHIDALAAHIARFNSDAEADTAAAGAPDADDAPTGTRKDASRVATVRVPAAPPPLRATKATLPPDYSVPDPASHAHRTGPAPFRTLPPGTTLRKGTAHGQAATTHVLFVGASARANSLHEALPPEAELLVTRAVDDAAQRAKDAGPDVIVAEVAGPVEAASLLQTLRADPLTEFFPVVLVAPQGLSADVLRERCPEAADVLPDNVDGQGLWDALERLLGGGSSSGGYDFGDLTLDELTRTLQDELRRGIVGAASPRARGARIQFGAGNEVLTATWEAIARIREVVERRSNGAVRFELPAAPRGLPGTQVLTVGAEDAPAPVVEADGEDPVRGRKVLVVDDDDAVRRSFRALLEESGAEVLEASDGARALASARRARPDLVIADIVMPGLDGFALCRAVRRDPAICHTPVILLSWREDLLVRMRELGAQAQGYLRKEAGGDAVLARVRDALRVRVRLLRRVAELSAGAEVRGRLERVGLFPLVVAASKLGDATVTVSDQASVTELHLRGGRLVSALRTGHDGSLLRGESALRPALGMTTARFAVTRTTAHVRENVSDPLEEILSRCSRVLVALEDTLTGSALLDVVRVEVDRDATQLYTRSLPGRLRALLERVVDGEAPRDLVLRDGVAPSDLSPLLLELARRGAVRGVIGAGGEDLTALRVNAGDSVLPPAESDAPSIPAPAPRGTRRLDGEPEGDDGPVVTLADAVWRELRDSVVDDPRKRKSSPAAPRPAAKSPARAPSEAPSVMLEPIALPIDDLPPLPEIGDPFEPLKTPASPVSAKLLAASKGRAEVETRKVAAVDAFEVVTRAQTRKVGAAIVPPEALASPALHADEPTTSALEPETLEVPDAVLESLQRASDEDAHPPARATTSASIAPRPPPPPAAASRPPPPPPSTQSVAPPPLRPRVTPPGEVVRSTAPPPLPATALDRSGERPKVAGRATTSTPPPRVPATTPAPRATRTTPEPQVDRPPTPVRPRASKSERLRWEILAIGVGAAFALSYYSMRWYLSRAPQEPAEDPSVEAPVEPQSPVAEAPAPAPATPPAVDAGPAVARLAPRPEADLGEYRDATPWLDGSVLPARSGVLAVSAPEGRAVSVQVDQRDVGVAPLHLVLAEGLHTVRFRAGDGWRYQFATVRAGQAVLLRAPQAVP